MIHLLREFVETVSKVHGEKGQSWLQNFDTLIEHCEQLWSLRALQPFQLSYNFVAPVVLQNGTDAVLKICVSQQEAQSEIAVLQAFDGRGLCKLLATEEDNAILLLERTKPGCPRRRGRVPSETNRRT